MSYLKYKYKPWEPGEIKHKRHVQVQCKHEQGPAYVPLWGLGLQHACYEHSAVQVEVGAWPMQAQSLHPSCTRLVLQLQQRRHGAGNSNMQ